MIADIVMTVSRGTPRQSSMKHKARLHRAKRNERAQEAANEAQDPADYVPVTANASDPGAMLFPTLRRGSTAPDVTLVTFGGMLPFVERAARRLQEDEELSVEIVVPALLAPLPRNTLLDLLLGRPRIAVVEESHHEFGVSAELLATLAEAHYSGSVIRMGAPPLPIAAARSLERDQLPDEQTIIDNILDLF